MHISTYNPTLGQPNTYLTSPASASATALTVANNSGFSSNDYVVVGEVAQEGAEIRQISGVTGYNTINVDALKFAASDNTPITFIKFNKVRFYLGDWSARYFTGTLSISKDSAVVTGTGTSWGSITTNYALLLNGKWYDIESIDSATQITLTENFSDEDLVLNDYALVLFSLQATVDITIDQNETIWDDIDAFTEDYYRTEFFNSTNSATSSRSSIISAAEEVGFSEYTLRSLEDEVLSELRDPDAKRRTRQEIDTDINNALKEMTNKVVSSVHEDYLSTFGTINLKSTKSEYQLPDDFRKLTSIWVAYNGVDYKIAQSMRIKDDMPEMLYDEGWPMYYLRDNVIGLRPIPSGNVTSGIKLWYDKRIPSLRNEGDELPFIFRDFKRAFVAYALDKAYRAEGDKETASNYVGEFQFALDSLPNALKTRDSNASYTVEVINDVDLYI